MKAPVPVFIAVPTPSATGMASPESLRRTLSNACAMSTVPRRKRRYPRHGIPGGRGGSESGLIGAVEHPLRIGAVDAANVDPCPFGGGRQDLEQEAPSIREKLGIAVILLHLLRYGLRDTHRRAALRSHPRQAVDALLLTEDDHPVRTPGAAASLHGVADLLCRTALAGIFRSWPSAKNPIQAPSGDQNG